MAYIGKSPTGTGVRSRFYYTQTSGGGTSISGTDDNSKTLTFTDGEYIDVYLNGVLLVAGTDYNTNTANTISGLAALANGDVVEVVVYDIFTVADTVSASQGGTFNAGVTMSDGLTVDDDGATPLTVDRATSDGTIIDVQKDGSKVGSIGAVGGDVYIGIGDAGLRFNNTDNEIVNVDDSGSALDDRISLGSDTSRFKNLYLSGNLYIGGTGSVNALDDYEEGTFTPTFQGVTCSYTSRSGTYTKIGRLVFVTVDMDVSSLDTTDGSVFQINIPFSAPSTITSALFSASIPYNETNLVPSSATDFINSGGRVEGSNFNLRAPYTSGAGTEPKYSQLNSSGRILFSFMYYTS